jgi:ABC-type hemin transport system ATPase subunit
MVLDLANRVVIVDGGRIHADGRPFQILADPDLMERHGLEVPAGIRHGRQTRL